MDRRDLQALSRVRLKESRALLRLGLYDGAYYLAGYAVECALKSCIAKRTVRHEFPDKKRVDSSYTHDLWSLLKVAGLGDAFQERARADASFKDNWDTVASWTEQSRYNRNEAKPAQDLFMAVIAKNHGILSWLKLYW
jgi:HEPN domain-containing protein